MTKPLRLLFVFLALTACVYPNRQTRTVDDRPSLSFVNAPPDAVLHVDGLEMGPANKYNGDPNILLLEPGTHHVEIRHEDKVLRSLDVFLGEGTRREISLSEGNSSK